MTKLGKIWLLRMHEEYNKRNASSLKTPIYRQLESIEFSGVDQALP